jgi:hypothetical protein
MAVKTSPFAGWRLSGRDAEIFSEQVDNSGLNPKAQDALARGRALCQQIEKCGYSSVNPKKENLLARAYRYIRKHILTK